MSREVILTCAVTGGHDNYHKHPNFPITPKQIADACLEARGAGAAVAHIHVRDPETGAHVGNPDYFREVVERIRDSGSDILINLTSGFGARYIPGDDDPRVGAPGTTLIRPQERMRHVLELRPDICTLDCGTFNFGENVFMNTPAHLRVMAGLAKEAGVTPEIECFEPGHILFAKQLMAEGLIEEPPLFQLVLGTAYASPASAEMMSVMRALLPKSANWAAFGISRHEFPMVAEAINQGGHVRVGLEDNLYLDRGVFASNGQLVERAATIASSLGAQLVEPPRAAELLDLPPRGQRAA